MPAIWVSFFDDWNSYFRNAKIRLDFDHFVSLYVIAPDNYDISRQGIKYIDPVTYVRYTIGFSYLDYRKFKRWLKRDEEKEKDLEKVKMQRDFLKSVNRDIDSYKANAKEEISEISARLQIQKRMGR